MADEVCFASIAELGRRYRSRDLSPVEVVDSLLGRIERLDPALNSYLTVLDRELRVAAKRAERRLLASGPELPPLFGIPVSVKDNIATARTRTTAGSRILADWVPERDAAAVSKLRAAGALIVGKVNLFEFAFGESHQDYGHVRNPWALDRSTAGSSTGSVAAVAAGLCWGSLATDTGGSIRVPAGFCGVVGLKPTYGRISTTGIVSTSWTMCHVGPIARTVQDAAHLFDALTDEDTASSLDASPADFRLAVALPKPSEPVDEQIRSATETACRLLEVAGANLQPIELPDMLLVRAMLWAIVSAEATDIHHEWLATRAEDYHPVVRARLERGKTVPATTYVRAQRARRWLMQQIDSLLANADALLLPLSPVLPYALGSQKVELDGREEEVSQAVTRYTPLASVTGRPALAVPCGFSADGLPIGLQLVGHPGGEKTLLRIAAAYEQLTDWHQRHPDPAAVEPIVGSTA